MTGQPRAEVVEANKAELARLRAIEEAARWHYANSACSGWPQGEVLALALGLDPEAPQKGFVRLAGLLGLDVEGDELWEVLR